MSGLSSSSKRRPVSRRVRLFRQARRVGTPVVGVALLVTGFATLQVSLSPKSEVTATLAAADSSRVQEAAASRGSARASDEPVAAETIEAPAPAAETTSAVETTTEVPLTSVPPTSEAPTTTTAAPTTLAPTTTTTTTAVAPPAAATSGNVQSGKASYYDYKVGGCAHKTLPKGTVVTVTNVANGKTATCVVNDRGPFIAGRIIDLDVSVFKQLASTSAGVFTARISW